MMKVKNYVCPECGKIFKTLGGWSAHIEKVHPDIVPDGWSYSRFFYYLQTGKTEGKCVMCKKPTDWNESSMKYNRFCNDPQCKVNYRKMFEKRNLDKYGYVHKLDDPEVQRKMLAARKISGEYTFKNSKGKLQYVGKDELAFLQMLDLLEWPADDIMSPSPHTYAYNYKNPNDKEHEGKHFYIPDFYIPSINCEVEVKDTSNNHHKIRAIDNVKDACKRKAMEENSMVNYVFIDQKNFEPFYELLFEIKRTYLNKEVEDKGVGRKMRLASNLAANESYINEFAEDLPPDEDNNIEWIFPAYEEVIDQGASPNEKTDIQPSTRSKHRTFRRKKSEMVTLYHGSENDYPYLMAMGMDLGNLIEKPGWSLFVAKDKQFTYRWAIFRAIRMARKNNARLEANIIWNPKLKTFSITEKTFEVMKDLFNDGSIVAYVYTIKVPREMVGIGNDSQHDERTIRTNEKIDYEYKEKFVITEDIARANGHILDTDQEFYDMERYYRRKPLVFNRGLTSLLMTRDYQYQNKENRAALKAIYAALNDGELNPGDDIEQFLRQKHLKIKSIGVLKRLLIAAGLEGIDATGADTPEVEAEFREMAQLLPQDKEFYLLEVVDESTNQVEYAPYYGDYEQVMETEGEVATEAVNINKFKAVHIGDKKLDDPAFKHVRTGPNCSGEAFYDGDKLVGFYMTERKDDAVWIQALVISPDYRGKGLSHTLLTRAIKKEGATRLSVNKKNTVAFELYKKHGFKVYDQTSVMYMMSLESYGLDMAEENAILSTKDTRSNVESWGKSPDKNILWITGFSGSGKTSLAREYVDDRTVMISLDDFFEQNLTTNYFSILIKYPDLAPRIKRELDAIAKTNPDNKSVFDMNKSEKDVVFAAYDSLIDAFIRCSKEDFGKVKYVIEGIQVYDFIPYDLIKGQPIIIKGTSALKSFTRRAKRDNLVSSYKENKASIKHIKEDAKEYYKWYKDSNRRIETLKDKLK